MKYAGTVSLSCPYHTWNQVTMRRHRRPLAWWWLTLHSIWAYWNSTTNSLNMSSFYFKKPLFGLKLILWVFIRHRQTWSALAPAPHSRVCSVPFLSPPTRLGPLLSNSTRASSTSLSSPCTPRPASYTFLLTRSLYPIRSNPGLQESKKAVERKLNPAQKVPTNSPISGLFPWGLCFQNFVLLLRRIQKKSKILPPEENEHQDLEAWCVTPDRDWALGDDYHVPSSYHTEQNIRSVWSKAPRNGAHSKIFGSIHIVQSQRHHIFSPFFCQKVHRSGTGHGSLGISPLLLIYWQLLLG